MPNLTQAPPGNRHRRALVVWLLICFAVAATASIFTAKAIPVWYASLAKPPYTPPNQLFGPVWTVLYTLMAIAAWMIWKQPKSVARLRAILLFCAQLGLNFLWTLLFFGLRNPPAAMVEIVALWLVILATMLVFFRLRRAAGWLLLPYLCWVGFAGLLNWGILQRN